MNQIILKLTLHLNNDSTILMETCLGHNFCVVLCWLTSLNDEFIHFNNLILFVQVETLP